MWKLGTGVAVVCVLGGSGCMDAASRDGTGGKTAPDQHVSPLVSVTYEDVAGTDQRWMPIPADVTLTGTNVAVFACLSAELCREWTLELRPEALEPGDTLEVCVADKCFDPIPLDILREGRAAPDCGDAACGQLGFPNGTFVHDDGRQARVAIVGAFGPSLGGAVQDLNTDAPGTFDVVTEESGIQICVAGDCFEGGAPRGAE